MKIYQIHSGTGRNSWSTTARVSDLIFTETEVIPSPTLKKQEFWGRMHLYLIVTDVNINICRSYNNTSPLNLVSLRKGYNDELEDFIKGFPADYRLLETRLFRIGTPEQVKWFKRCYASVNMKPATFSKYIKLRTKSIIHHELEIWQ